MSDDVSWAVHTSQDSAVCVQVSGEIDLTARARLRGAIDAALGCGREVGIDLRDVGFIDSSGIHELLHAKREASTRGVRLVIRPPLDPAALLPFQVLDLFTELPFADDPTPTPPQIDPSS